MIRKLESALGVPDGVRCISLFVVFRRGAVRVCGQFMLFRG
jgi:hypothetical protein